MARDKRNRKLALENLQDRKLFAVDVFSSGGDLVINGDGAADNVSVYRYASGTNAGQYRVTVNGVVDPQLYNVSDDIRASLGDGDDTLTIYNADLQGSNSDMVIDMGRGDDDVFIHNARVARDMFIETEGYDNIHDGNDTAGVYFSDIGRDLVIRTRDGEDVVQVFHSDIGDDMLIYTGEHADEVDLSYVDADDWMRVWTGSGNDDLSVYGSSARVGDFRGQGGSDSMSKINSSFTWLNWTYGDDDQWD